MRQYFNHIIEYRTMKRSLVLVFKLLMLLQDKECIAQKGCRAPSGLNRNKIDCKDHGECNNIK